MAIDTATLLIELQELIEALDRRTPRVAQAGEAAIARDAAALRARAAARIADLQARGAGAPAVSVASGAYPVDRAHDRRR